MFKFLFKIFVVIFVLWLGGFIAFNYHISNYKIDNETKTDAIIVLTGGKNRISEAVNLLNNGLGEKLFISGVQKDISLKEISKRKDVDIKTTREIIIEKDSLNTVENAKETIDWINKNNVKSIRLVTSNYHIPRSLVEFQSRGKDITIILHPVYSENVQTPCWKNWGSFYLIASEYNKFLYAYVRAKLINGNKL